MNIHFSWLSRAGFDLHARGANTGCLFHASAHQSIFALGLMSMLVAFDARCVFYVVNVRHQSVLLGLMYWVARCKCVRFLARYSHAGFGAHARLGLDVRCLFHVVSAHY